MEAQDPADYQDETCARFPVVAKGAPTLAGRGAEFISRPRRENTPYQTREELDKAQDDLVHELKRFPARR